MMDNNFKLQQIALHITQIMNSYVFVHYAPKKNKNYVININTTCISAYLYYNSISTNLTS